jgi:hypothetical protein
MYTTWSLGGISTALLSTCMPVCRSGQTAPQSLVYKIERSLENSLIALGDFLDVKCEFDNTTFGSMCKAAEEHGVERGVVKGSTPCFEFCKF